MKKMIIFSYYSIIIVITDVWKNVEWVHSHGVILLHIEG